jgi:hypothetical protein
MRRHDEGNRQRCVTMFKYVSSCGWRYYYTRIGGLEMIFEWKLNTQYGSLGVKEYNYINFSYAKSIWG